FEAEWEVNTDLPGGGIIVGRGEGSNGVISVNLPMPPPTEAGEEPIQLTADEVSYMNITVIDDQGASRHFTEEHIRSISYDILFEYEWDNGIRQGYQIKHTAGTK
ncbi:MAG: hypothetical protein JXA28_12225, partial [Bacteroidetes bacterium]|nr:hypothetical protein [Bacteroidota bacterium]